VRSFRRRTERLAMTQTPVSTLQPALTLTEFLDATGVFPSEGVGSGPGPVVGSIGIFAGPTFEFNDPADGQIFPIANNTALFSILGTTFGGDGASNFQLPNLGGIATIGAGQGAGLPLVNLGQTLGRISYDLTPAQLPPNLGGASAAIDTQQPSLGLNYVINAFGAFPGGTLTLNSLGVVSAFAGNFAPGDELLCDGQLLQISQFSSLFNLIGTTYGGDGVTTFALPDLQGRDIVGAGDGFTLGEQVGAANVSLTNANSPLGSDAPVTNQQPGLVMNYYIALQGIFPSEGETGNSSQQTPYLGQIVASAANMNDPQGWALCDGQLLPINQNQALFAVLGTTYGGDGQTTFALPDLQGRTVLGTGGVNGLGTLGQISGASATTLTSANLPALPDLLWQNANGQASIWELNGTNVIGAASSAVSPNPGPNWRAVGTADFFGGGSSDILWQNTGTGQASIWEMSGTTLIGGGPVSPNPGPNWHAVGTGDFNHDGRSDILWQNTSTGQASIWEMKGTTLIGGGPVSPNPGPAWKAVGTGDFFGGGDSDILWQNTSTGQVSIWEMSDNTLIGGGPVSPNPGPAWQAIGTGDFNGDGRSDILFQNTTSGQVSIWEMSGNSLIGGGPASANPGPSWHAIGTDGGGSDILFQNTSGQATIWEMSGTNIAGGGPISPNPGPSWRAVGLT
jgi:microcystin-dependent protein